MYNQPSNSEVVFRELGDKSMTHLQLIVKISDIETGLNLHMQNMETMDQTMGTIDPKMEKMKDYLKDMKGLFMNDIR